MRRNENVIADVPCAFTQQALLQCTDPPTLERLTQAFPNAFIGVSRVGTWEEIRSRWKEWCRKVEWSGDNDDVFYVSWLPAFTDEGPLHIGDYLEFGSFDESEKPAKDGEEIVSEIKGQLEEVESFARPITIRYLGDDWIVGWLGYSNGDLIEDPDDLLFGDDDDEKYCVQLIRSECIAS